MSARIGRCSASRSSENSVLIDSGQFQEIDIKSRAVRLNKFLIGSSSEQRAFVHVKLSILSGRSAEMKRELSRKLLERLQKICNPDQMFHIQLCVEVLEIDWDCYSKTVISPNCFHKATKNSLEE
jgi:5-carboxymethyl-2-hydroxymuconate isomerase